MRIQRRQITAETALARLEQQCSRAEISEGEAREKLRRWHIPPSDSDKIAESLINRRFIDDRRFACAYVNDKVRFSRWGRRKIMSGLMQKRISSDIIAEALGEIDEETYASGLRHIIKSKINARPEIAETYEQRTKLFRWILSRGYESQLAAAELRRILSEMRED